MHVLIVQAHPEPGSFNGQLTTVACAALEAAGQRVTISDLYAQNFDPLEAAASITTASTRAASCRWPSSATRASEARCHRTFSRRSKLEAADLLLLQFPLWWHGPPAMLKGWFDRVFVSGRIYRSRKRYDSGHFRGKRAALCHHRRAGGPFGPGARGGDMEVMLWPLHYSLHYLGFSVLAAHCHFEASGTATAMGASRRRSDGCARTSPPGGGAWCGCLRRGRSAFPAGMTGMRRDGRKACRPSSKGLLRERIRRVS